MYMKIDFVEKETENRFKNLVIEEIDMAENHKGNFLVPCTDFLIEEVNNIRKQLGYKDLVDVNYDNCVYYTFYLMFNTDEMIIKLVAECNHGELDDFCFYEIDLTEEDKKVLTFKIIRYLTDRV